MEKLVLLSQTHTGASYKKICHLITQQAKHNVQGLFEESAGVTSTVKEELFL